MSIDVKINELEDGSAIYSFDLTAEDKEKWMMFGLNCAITLASLGVTLEQIVDFYEKNKEKVL